MLIQFEDEMGEANHSITSINWAGLVIDHLVLDVISSAAANEDCCLVVVHVHETSPKSKKTTAG